MNPADEAEINIHEYVSLLLRWRWRITIFVVIVTAGTTTAAYVLPKKYDAVVLISPVSSSSNSGLLGNLSSLTSQYSGLASLVGIPQSNDTNKSESLAALQSEALTEQYIRQNNLLPVLYRSDWDQQHNRWKVTDASKIPTLWKANQLFKKKIRSVVTDSKSGLITLTITWTDAETAAIWANDLVKIANDYRRDKAIRESERNVTYLTSEASKTDVVGIKQAIYSVLQSEISKIMAAKGSEEYAFKVIDPAFPPEKPTSPQPLYWTLVAFAASLCISMGIAFFRVALIGP